jgi:FtsH-binding integral membrane protein
LLFKDTTPIPVLLRGAFLLFTLVLMAVGTALILCYPYVFPWPLQPQTSIVFGWVFMGASLFFLHGFIYAVRGNVRGQLLGFIAYDLILLIPFFEHIQKVTAERQLSLSVYLGVIIFSLGLSIYYLFMHPHTRFRWRHG